MPTQKATQDWHVKFATLIIIWLPGPVGSNHIIITNVNFHAFNLLYNKQSDFFINCVFSYEQTIDDQILSPMVLILVIYCTS